MQETAASEVPQAKLAVLSQPRPADKARGVLHLCSGDGCHRASLDILSATPADGGLDLWGAMRLRWQSGLLRA